MNTTQRIDRDPLMRHNQKLTFEELRQEVHEAVKGYEGTQAGLAEKLGVSGGAISRAIHEAGPLLAGLQMRVLEYLQDEYAIAEETEVWFRVTRKR